MITSFLQILFTNTQVINFFINKGSSLETAGQAPIHDFLGPNTKKQWQHTYTHNTCKNLISRIFIVEEV